MNINDYIMQKKANFFKKVPPTSISPATVESLQKELAAAQKAKNFWTKVGIGGGALGLGGIGFGGYQTFKTRPLQTPTVIVPDFSIYSKDNLLTMLKAKPNIQIVERPL